MNIWAILVAAVSSMIIGSIWWGPLFGKYWMKENGFDKLTPTEHEKMKKGMTGMYLQQFALSVIQAWVLAYILQSIGFVYGGTATKICYTTLLWLGFMFPLQYGNKLWGGKSFKFVFLTTLNSLITLVVMGLIIGAWR